MKQLIAGLALGCSLLAAALPAGAAPLSASASASITNIRFTVTDLDPNDGIDASYAFIANPMGGADGYYPSGSVADAGSLFSSSWNAVDGALAPVARSIGDGSTWGYSSSVGPDSLVANALETRGGAWGHAGAISTAGMNTGAVDAPVLQRLLLVLSPDTMLTVTADMTTTASLDCPLADQLAYNCRSVAFAFLQFNGVHTLAGTQSSDFLHLAGNIHTQAVNNETSTVTGGVNSGMNTGDQYLVIGFQAYAYADSDLGRVSNVPEPSSLALAMFALVPLAVAARRRRSRR